MIRATLDILNYRIGELGEIVVNMPRVALSPGLQSTLPYLGSFCLALILAGVWLKGSLRPTDVFFVGYVVILFSWPYYDPRFWLPVLPLMIGYARLPLDRFLHHRFWRVAGGAYLMAFAVRGLLMFFSSTLVTFSGSNFPNVYLEPRYRSTYCAVYPVCGGGTTQSTPVDEAALHVYRTFK
jgi:hypothetical protein